jgi:hypothetical protein
VPRDQAQILLLTPGGDKVKLYFDVYGAKYWMGDGGIFAVLKDQSEDVQLVSSDFIVI